MGVIKLAVTETRRRGKGYQLGERGRDRGVGRLMECMEVKENGEGGMGKRRQREGDKGREESGEDNGRGRDTENKRSDIREKKKTYRMLRRM